MDDAARLVPALHQFRRMAELAGMMIRTAASPDGR